MSLQELNEKWDDTTFNTQMIAAFKTSFLTACNISSHCTALQLGCFSALSLSFDLVGVR